MTYIHCKYLFAVACSLLQILHCKYPSPLKGWEGVIFAVGVTPSPFTPGKKRKVVTQIQQGGGGWLDGNGSDLAGKEPCQTKCAARGGFAALVVPGCRNRGGIADCEVEWRHQDWQGCPSESDLG